MPDLARARVIARSVRGPSGILDISSEVILVTDEHLTVLMASRGAKQLFGYEPEELIGLKAEALMPPRYRIVHRSHVAGFVQGDRPGLRMDDRSEVFALRKDGTEFAIEASLSKRVTEGQIFFTIIVRDVAARRAAEARLKASERRLAIAVANADLHVFELDYEAAALLRAGAEDTVFDFPITFESAATDPFGLLAPEHRHRAKRAWIRHRRTGDPFRIEARIMRTDAVEVWGLITAELIEQESGQPQRLIGALQDITRRRRDRQELERTAAAAQAANIAKSTFLATMSHEIRTPLNGVLGMAHAMSRDELTDLQHQRLAVIQNSGETLLSILNDVLDLSKIEAGKLELEHIPFDPADILRGVEATFAAAAADKGLQLIVDASHAAAVLLGDPTRIRQVIYNLVSNAVKFTPTGRVELTGAYAGGALVLKVRDSGIGMTAEQQAALFSPFVQADASTTRRFGGTGLGLTICKELIDRMGGEISVLSTPGGGSLFRIEIPLSRGSAAPVAPPSAQDDQLKLRILAAEDNPTNQLVLRTLLDQIGATVAIAQNGVEAVNLWDQEPFDVLLMDVHMPDMDGVAATREIRRREQLTARRRTPIIALTANALSHQVDGYLAAGMDRCVTKPINFNELVEALCAVAAEAAMTPETAVG